MLTPIETHRDSSDYEPEAFHLTFPRPEIDSSVVEVHWCLLPDAYQDLKREGARHPQILIVTCNKTGENEERYLFPLEDGRAYLSLRHSGFTHVFASIVWGQKKQYPRECYFTTSGKSWCNNVVTYERPNVRPATRFKEGQISDRLGLVHYEVTVPDGVFAEKPWDWKWTNMWFSTWPHDQCDFRRRRFLSFTVQPVGFLIFSVLAIAWEVVVWSLLKLLGLRGVGPFAISPIKIFDSAPLWANINGLGDSIFIYRFKSGRRFWPGLALSPVFWVPYASIWMLATGNGLNTAGWFIAASILHIMIGMAIAWAGLSFLGLIFSLIDRQHEGEQVFPWQRAWYEDQRTVATLICPLPGDAAVKPTPGRRQTLHLRFLDLKAKVCRPFSA